MPVTEALALLGGVATRAALVRATSRADVDAAVAAGEVVVLARGRYAAPSLESDRATAHELTAVLSHRTAALHHGWAVKVQPAAPDVIVPRNRRLTVTQAARMTVHRAVLHDTEVVDGVTGKERTMADCLRALPFDEALAIADSALRAGESHRWLVAVARDLRGPGASGARRIAALASGKSANPFESVLRAIAEEVEGLSARPQVPIHDPDFLARPDLVDEDLRIVMEARPWSPPYSDVPKAAARGVRPRD